jgi:predicted RNA-binding Zn-ribbon protein involved in translation (DUF1610 family)
MRENTWPTMEPVRTHNMGGAPHPLPLREGKEWGSQKQRDNARVPPGAQSAFPPAPPTLGDLMRLGERWGREIVCDLSREIPNMVRWCLSTLSHVWCGGTVIAHVLHCPSCQGTDIVRHGTTPEGKQRYQCRECLLGRGRTFLLAYPYAGQSPEVKQPIVEMAINARGRRDTARVLHVSPTTL